MRPPRAAVRLSLAQALASRHGAELTAIYGVLPSLLVGPWMGGEGVAPAAAMLADADREQRARARAAFEQTAGRDGVGWTEVIDEALLWALKGRALYADLMVLGPHDPGDTRTGALPHDLVPTLVNTSGKPTLVVPHTVCFEPCTRKLLVAWKPTREAARAVTAALPWLQQADAVHLAGHDDACGAGGTSFVALAHWLMLHGVQAPVTVHRLGTGEAGGLCCLWRPTRTPGCW